MVGQDGGFGATCVSAAAKKQGGCLSLAASATKYLQHTLDFPYKNNFVCQNGRKDPNVNEIQTHIAHYSNANFLQKEALLFNTALMKW